MAADNYFINSITKQQIEQDENLKLKEIDGHIWLTINDCVGTIPNFDNEGYLYFGKYGVSGGELARYLYLKYKVLWHELDTEQFLYYLEELPEKDYKDILYYACFRDMLRYGVIDENEVDYSIFDKQNAISLAKKVNHGEVLLD